MGMFERGRSACFAYEQIYIFRVLGELRSQYFNSDIPVKIQLPRPEDITHSADAENLDELVIAQNEIATV